MEARQSVDVHRREPAQLVFNRPQRIARRLAGCGIGFALMVSLRDPLRDIPLFQRFAQGVFAGCVGLAFLRMVDFQRSELRRLSYVPLLGAIALSTLLIVFGIVLAVRAGSPSHYHSATRAM